MKIAQKNAHGKPHTEKNAHDNIIWEKLFFCNY